MTILVDFIHVLEYLWKAAWCFHQPRDPAMEDWVTTQAQDILHGRVPQVITRIRQLAATTRPGQAASTRRSSARPCPTWTPSSPTWTTPPPWPAGWPIATGVIEGACRHLVDDRMGITGARWGLPGAQAMLWLAPSTPAATWTPTGTTTSSKNTSATTSAATPAASTSQHKTHSKRAAPMSHSSARRRRPAAPRVAVLLGIRALEHQAVRGLIGHRPVPDALGYDENVPARSTTESPPSNSTRKEPSQHRYSSS